MYMIEYLYYNEIVGTSKGFMSYVLYTFNLHLIVIIELKY